MALLFKPWHVFDAAGVFVEGYLRKAARTAGNLQLGATRTLPSLRSLQRNKQTVLFEIHIQHLPAKLLCQVADFC